MDVDATGGIGGNNGGNTTLRGSASMGKLGASGVIPRRGQTGYGPFRNLKSPRGGVSDRARSAERRGGTGGEGGTGASAMARSVTPMGRITEGQRKLKQLNSSLAMICITREMLSQYEEELNERSAAAKRAGETEYTL